MRDHLLLVSSTTTASAPGLDLSLGPWPGASLPHQGSYASCAHSSGPCRARSPRGGNRFTTPPSGVVEPRLRYGNTPSAVSVSAEVWSCRPLSPITSSAMMGIISGSIGVRCSRSALHATPPARDSSSCMVTRSMSVSMGGLSIRCTQRTRCTARGPNSSRGPCSNRMTNTTRLGGRGRRDAIDFQANQRAQGEILRFQ